MEGEERAQGLMGFYFGEAAGRAEGGASRRLRRWSQAFEAWMGERRRNYQRDTAKQSVLAWRRLARQCGKMPWEMRREDIEKHAAWMEEEGYAKTTIHCALGMLASFFTWCDEHEVDKRCGKGFNPAREASRPRVGRYEGARLWSREEVERLLGAARQDATEVGRRDLAFFLCRLGSGAPLKSLLQLRWGQIEQDGRGAWVRWREKSGRVRLAEEAWEAVRGYLRASGRLEGMAEGTYVFAPLKAPGQELAGSRKEDWVEGKPVSSSQILAGLKLYGRAAGIAEEKLTLMALRRTAMRLRMEEGESVEEMQAFMDSQEERKSAKYRLGKLPELPEGSSARALHQRRRGESHPSAPFPRKREDLPDPLPFSPKFCEFKGIEKQAPDPGKGGRLVRRARPFRPGEGVKHGMYARSQPVEEVRRVMEENIEGVEEEIEGLRLLIRGLAEREGDFLQLGEAYSLAAKRLGELAAGGKKREEEDLDRRERKAWGEEYLERMDVLRIEEGKLPDSEEIREAAWQEWAKEGRQMAEEIATLRLVLRNALRLALETEENQGYIRLVNLYSSGCLRLAKLMGRGRDEEGWLERYLRKQLNLALEMVVKEWELAPTDAREGDLGESLP